jgi:hypothetical protein
MYSISGLSHENPLFWQIPAKLALGKQVAFKSGSCKKVIKCLGQGPEKKNRAGLQQQWLPAGYS